MKPDQLSDSDLRRSFAFPSEEAGSEACPTAGRIWDGAHGLLPADEAGELVDHIATCASCAADWRLAMDAIGSERSGTRPIKAPTRRLRGRLGIGLAAAVAVVALALVGTTQVWFAPPETVTYRDDQELTITSLLPDGGTLPRDAAELRWSAPDADATYTVEVGLPDLTPVDVAHDLTATTYQIPARALAELEAGTTIVWQVRARLPDGRQVASPAFLATLD